MAEGFLKSFDPELLVYSAGTNPVQNVNPNAVKVMAEVGINISGYYTKNVNQFLHKSFDYVITVCDNARDECPLFFGNVSYKLHIGFEDPANVSGNENEILTAFRNTRDNIKQKFYNFYISEIANKEKFTN
jgi:arsenate reductase